MEPYQGYELGPIRPPSEAQSLLLRITRNCPWNRCTFCGIYKGERFSVRPVEHVKRDIDRIRQHVSAIERVVNRPGGGDRRDLLALQPERPASERLAFQAALNWLYSGMKSVFLQDANSLVVKPDHLVAILNHLREAFPQIERITSYARSHSIARISDEDMARLAAAGLNRIHIGLESGADAVLEFVKKGVDKETQVIAGQKVKRAGIELSEYFMPGLGGEKFSRENALETAEALSRIDPDFIRIRSLAISPELELFQDCQSGAFRKLGEVGMVEELLLFLENLRGIHSRVKSDHVLNLFPEVDGRLPDDRQRLTAPLRAFLALAPDEQLLCVVGRRTGIFSRFADLYDPTRRRQVEALCAEHQITLDNLDDFSTRMMAQLI
ncbi:radical SAM family protein [Geothermobacter ehrlichii]|uniref:Radical SAM family protein n=1 Tax=Geothermobacter ehrlichii TaxID=213224 RepID=A0A5D3WIX3_9BACT|nr:radical SAM protein [Geothermobacter ehrlichii]TYO98839.1 radical SAM family protein [Geothermobacter ehrlichii]